MDVCTSYPRTVPARTAGSSAVLLAAAAFSLVATGCGDTPISSGPTFPLHERSTTAARVDAVPLRIIDHRPEWEQQYREPCEDPRGFKFAVGFIPLENFRPALEQQLVNTVDDAVVAQAERLQRSQPIVLASATDEAPAPPTVYQQPASFGSLTIESFRVVVNERAQRKHEYECLYPPPHAHQPPLHMEFGDSFHLDLGVSVASDPIVERPQPLFSPGFKFVNGKRVLVGPPPELEQPYPPGVTCQLQAEAVLVWPGQPDLRIPLSCQAGVDHTREEHGLTRDSAVQQSVNLVLKEVRRQLNEQLSEVSRTRT